MASQINSVACEVCFQMSNLIHTQHLATDPTARGLKAKLPSIYHRKIHLGYKAIGCEQNQGRTLPTKVVHSNLNSTFAGNANEMSCH